MNDREYILFPKLAVQKQPNEKSILWTIRLRSTKEFFNFS